MLLGSDKFISDKTETPLWRRFSLTMGLLIVVFIGTQCSQYSSAVNLCTNPIWNDSIPTDTIKMSSDSSRFSKDALDKAVNYHAEDSIVYDIENKMVHLYGKAHVDYDDITLDAAYIQFNWDANTVSAFGLKDSNGKEYGLPHFMQGDEAYDAREIAFNFKTRKGRISELLTQQDEGYLHSEIIKRSKDETYFGLHNKFTTCNYAEPDFYIAANKVKVIPKKVIVTGPANLVVAGVPTPLFVPFAIFPFKQGRTKGIIIPEYGERTDLGFFLANGGYYFPVKDHLDFAITGTIFSRGTWGLNLISRYNKRYRYSGNVSMKFIRERSFNPADATNYYRNQFNVQWNYNLDQKANPNYRFSAAVNFATSGYNRRYTSQVDTRLNNQLGSSISYSKIFRKAPLNFTATANHNQNLANNTVSIGLPDINFGMSQINPFKRNSVVGRPKWYEKITVSYNANARNNISGVDSVLFRGNDANAILRRLMNVAAYGARHSIPVNASFNVLKFLTVTPSVSFSQWFYGKSIVKRWNADSNRIEMDTLSGFRSVYEYNAGVSINTRLYGMFQFRGKIKAIRHVMNPTLSFNYRPDFAQEQYNIYRSVQSDSTGNKQLYSVFENGLYGSPGAGRQGAISLNINNNLEMKVRSRKDTITGFKKVKIIDRFDFSTAYNLAVDTLQFQPVVIRAITPLFTGLNMNMNVNWDPYAIDRNSLRRYNKYYYDEAGKLLRFTTASIAINGSFRSMTKKQPQKNIQVGPENLSEYELLLRYPDFFVDFDIPWNFSFNYALQMTKVPLKTKDTLKYSQNLSLRGDLSITQNWKVNVVTNIDLVAKKISTTTIEVYRDLHCWQMRFVWIPVGTFRSYNFNLNVKSTLLQDLKISRRRGWNEFVY
jgi:hypothetical protein